MIICCLSAACRDIVLDQGLLEKLCPSRSHVIFAFTTCSCLNRHYREFLHIKNTKHVFLIYLQLSTAQSPNPTFVTSIWLTKHTMPSFINGLNTACFVDPPKIQTCLGEASKPMATAGTQMMWLLWGCRCSLFFTKASHTWIEIWLVQQGLIKFRSLYALAGCTQVDLLGFSWTISVSSYSWRNWSLYSAGKGAFLAGRT